MAGGRRGLAGAGALLSSCLSLPVFRIGAKVTEWQPRPKCDRPGPSVQSCGAWQPVWP